jgi:hypothetical protein
VLASAYFCWLRATLPHEAVQRLTLRSARKDGGMKIPRLHLRDLFWLTVVVAVAIGYWMQRSEITRLRSEITDLEASTAMIMDMLEQTTDALAEKQGVAPVYSDKPTSGQ